MRKIKILNMLKNDRIISAETLAEIFEVSKRSILRDMDALIGQGYPIETKLGRHGGFKFEDGYQFRLDILTQDQYTRLSHLVDIMAVHPNDYKLKDAMSQTSWINYDLSGWRETDKELFSKIEYAIYQKSEFEFMYTNANGSIGKRNVRPQRLELKDRFWYMIALDGSIEKMYKLRRILGNDNVKVIDETKDAYIVELKKHKIFKILDECDVFEIEEINHERSRVHFYVPDGDWIVDFVLSFGDTIKVLEPLWLKTSIQNAILNMMNIYK